MNTVKENRANGKRVIKCEFISSKQVVVTYQDFTRYTFTASDFKAMHKDVAV